MEGEGPIISVADRNWNDDNIAATVELETTTKDVSSGFSIHYTKDKKL